MKSLATTLFLLAAALQQVAAELTYTVTATHNGEAVDPSEIKVEPFDKGSTPLNLTSAPAVPAPPSRTRKSRMGRRALGTATTNNWCGAVAQVSGTTKITKVHSYFQAPTLHARTGVTSYPQYVGEWVGIDGYTNSVILQSGVAHSISSGGTQSNYAWFQWYPSPAYTIPNFPVAAGDWIEVTITTSSTTSGTVTISNLSQSYTYTVNLTGGTALSRVSAEWIVEDPASGSSYVPFASFSDVWFESVYATTSTGSNLGVDASTLLSITGGKCTSNEYDNSDFWAHSS